MKCWGSGLLSASLMVVLCCWSWPSLSLATPITYDVGGTVWLSFGDQYNVQGTIVLDDEWTGGYSLNAWATSDRSLYSWDYTFNIISFGLLGQTDSGLDFSSIGSGGYISFHRGPMGSDGGEGRWLLEGAGFSEPWRGRSNFRSAIPGDFGLYDLDPSDFHLADAFGLNGSWDGFSPPMSNLTLSRAVLPVPEPKTIIMFSAGMVIGSLWSVKRKKAKLYV